MALLIVPACSDTGMRPTFRVAGRVLFGGKPARGAVVAFHPIRDSARTRPRIVPNAECADDGTFEMSTYLPFDGSPAGEYAVTISAAKKPHGKVGEAKACCLEKEDLPAEYGNKDETPLRYTVVPGDNPPAEFEIDPKAAVPASAKRSDH